MKHFDFVYLTGLDEEMILTGMATRRSSLTLTSECIKAATTTDSRIGFQISIPERGVAFQHRLPNSPTRTTGACCFVKESGPFVTFKNNLTVLLLEGGAGRLNANAFINVNEGFIAKQWQRSMWSWFPLYWYMNEMDISNLFFWVFFFGHMHNSYCSKDWQQKLKSSAGICCRHMVAR